MSEGRLFKCPSCGSSLSLSGSAAEVQCSYCGSKVIVPKELRDTPPIVVQMNGSASEPAPASGRSLAAAIVLFLLAFGACAALIVGINIFTAEPTPTPVAKVVSSPTPAGFAHVVLSFGGEGTAPGLFQDPRHITVDSNGKIYVADYKTLRVQAFDPSGKYVSGWTVDASLCTNKSATVNNISADRTGNVYVSYCGWIVKYDGASGKELNKFKGANGPANDFYLGVFALPSGGLLAWADGAPNSDEVVLRLDADGKTLARMPQLITNQSGNRASALTITPIADGLGNLYVLNGDDYMIYKFTPDGKFVNKFGGVGTGVGQFITWARKIALDNKSRVFVVDGAGIKIFDSNGVYQDQMSDRVVGGIQDFTIDDKNAIYAIGGNSTIYKLEMNAY